MQRISLRIKSIGDTCSRSGSNTLMLPDHAQDADRDFELELMKAMEMDKELTGAVR